MHGLHVEFVIKPGREADFLEWKRREGELQRKTPGFIKRSMCRSVENPRVFYYTTWWQSAEAMHAFSQSPEFKRAQEETGALTVAESRLVTPVTEVFDERGEFPDG
jgi:heme-degrading monooxygenase HmoA